MGLVETQTARFESRFEFQSGKSIEGFELVYETYGQLNASRSNAILICHALSGHHHAAGYAAGEDRPGWWDNCIGPGKPIDTDLFYVVSLNNLGGCHGSTGPRAINPETGRAWGPDFPRVSVKDWVTSQAMLSDSLEIDQWAAIIGGSLGGMQALQWSIDFPERVRHALLIAAATKLSAQNIAFNEIARLAIQGDPNFTSGSSPKHGLGLARMIGHVTYLSDLSMREKFGREIRSGEFEDLDVQFQVESYLHYQGEKFAADFDPHTYIIMTRALDYFDPAAEFNNDFVAALKDVMAGFLVVSFSTDWRFSPERSQEIVDAMITAGVNVSSVNIEASSGHDSFLMEIDRYFDVLRTYLRQVATELPA